MGTLVANYNFKNHRKNTFKNEGVFLFLKTKNNIYQSLLNYLYIRIINKILHKFKIMFILILDSQNILIAFY